MTHLGLIALLCVACKDKGGEAKGEGEGEGDAGGPALAELLGSEPAMPEQLAKVTLPAPVAKIEEALPEAKPKSGQYDLFLDLKQGKAHYRIWTKKEVATGLELSAAKSEDGDPEWLLSTAKEAWGEPTKAAKKPCWFSKGNQLRALYDPEGEEELGKPVPTLSFARAISYETLLGEAKGEAVFGSKPILGSTKAELNALAEEIGGAFTGSLFTPKSVRVECDMLTGAVNPSFGEDGKVSGFKYDVPKDDVEAMKAALKSVFGEPKPEPKPEGVPDKLEAFRYGDELLLIKFNTWKLEVGEVSTPLNDPESWKK